MGAIKAKTKAVSNDMRQLHVITLHVKWLESDVVFHRNRWILIFLAIQVLRNTVCRGERGVNFQEK